MNRIAPLAALSLVLATACSREESAPAAAPQAAPAATAPAAPATPARLPATAPVAAPTAEDPTIRFDKASFAGTFAGGGLSLQLRPDGRYTLQAPEGESEGAWTHEAASGWIRLDPGSKSARDRVFRMTSRDALALLDTSGAPTDVVLQRDGAR